MKGFKYVQQDLRNLLREQHTLGLKLLPPIAEQIASEARAIVPVKSGVLRESINVRVSRSPRYPGIVATASAVNPKTGYDYATIQHENPDYHHEAPGQYKFIEEPFNKAVEQLFKEL